MDDIDGAGIASPLRRRLRAVLVGIAVIAVSTAVSLALLGDGGDGENIGFLPPPDVSTTTVVDEIGEDIVEANDDDPSAGIADDTGPRADLVVVDVSVLGEGFVFQDPAHHAGLGPLDLAAAAAVEVDVEAERSLLETRRFQGAHARRWLRTDGDAAYVAVYEFATAEGAAAYVVDGNEIATGRGATAFDVVVVDGARGFTTVEERARGSFVTHVVAAPVERYVALVVVASPSGSLTSDDAVALTRRQVERLTS